MKNLLKRVVMAAALPLILQTASAAVLLSDNFNVIPGASSSDGNQNMNANLDVRQGGLLAPAPYIAWHAHHQIGNTGTDAGQPGAPSYGGYVLTAFGGNFFNDLDIANVASGPLTIEIDMYSHNGDWIGMTLRGPGDSWVIAGSGEFGFLKQPNGGLQMFQNGGNIQPAGWNAAGFATDPHMSFTFTDTAGTGSAFNGNGSQVIISNGTALLGTVTLTQLNSSGLKLGFRAADNSLDGLDNLTISGTPGTAVSPGQNLSFEYDLTSNASSTPWSPAAWTRFNGEAGNPDIGTGHPGDAEYLPNNPLTATADGNQYLYVNSFNGQGLKGVYQDMGALKTNSIYTLTVAIGSRLDRINSPGIIKLIQGVNEGGTVLATGGGLPSTQGTWQDYTVTFTTGPTVSGDLTVVLATQGAGTIQADFDNVRLNVQTLSFPPPFLVSDTSPASATVGISNNAVFTASFSNSPSVTLQWQKVAGGVTNNINTGVVTVTNNQVVTSTLTLTNLQLADAGSYRLRAVNQAGTAVYTLAAPLTVVPTITWYAAGTYNSTFVDNTVLGLAGSVADEVYGVDFGPGFKTTDNGYTFDDYLNSGNMSIAGTVSAFGSYESGASTGDFQFDDVLNNGVHGSSANVGTLNNLTIGQTYTVLVLMDDTRSNAGGPNFQVTDGVTTSPAQRYTFVNGIPAVGGYIMGTFTARATTQPLTVINPSGTQYNAILLEKGIASAPPIPPTLTTDLLPPVLKVTTGGPVNLSVGASGSLPLQYQWSDQNGPINGATNSNYSFAAVTGTSTYQVIVTNAFGSVASSIATVISSTNIVTVNNFSFEAGTHAGVSGQTIPLAWSDYNNHDFSTVANNNYSVVNPLAPPADGNNFFALNEGPSQPTGGIYQDVGPLKTNTTYTLTVAIGLGMNFGPGSPNPGLGSPGIISLINGVDNTGTLLATTNGRPATRDTWQDYTVTFITGDTVSGDLVVQLSVANANTYQSHFDNVRLTQAPAPAIIPPSITKDITLRRNEVATGESFSLSVTANGTLPLHFQWYNQNGPISGATSSNYTFNAVAGTTSYYVTVSNAAPDGVTSSTAVVISDPSFVTVNNFSFENGSTGSGNLIFPLTWTPFNNNNFSAIGNDHYPAMPDGNNFYGVNEGPSDPTGGIYQDVGPLLPYTTYTLTVATGLRDDFTPGNLGSPGIISLLNGTDNSGTLLASTSGIPSTPGTWQDNTVSFTTGASVSGHLTIALSAAGASTYQANFDNVRLTKAGIFQFAPVKVSGGNLILQGVGGTANAGYSLLSTTNLADPGSWITNFTGTLDGAGAFSNSIPVGTIPARFYRVRMP